MSNLTSTATFALFLLANCVFATGTSADEEAPQPQINGRPVMLVVGKVVVYPEGVDEAPNDYKGALGGAPPLALITIDKKIVGEIYAARLNKTPVEEAKGMAASAEGEKISLTSRTTIKKEDQRIEVVTLKIDADSNFGSPWIFHSLYFPQRESTVTFKLAAGEEDFKRALPYFEAMLFSSLKHQGK